MKHGLIEPEDDEPTRPSTNYLLRQVVSQLQGLREDMELTRKTLYELLQAVTG